MDCFIKKIFNGVEDPEVHKQFVRFSKGTYEGRAITTGHKTSNKIKIKGSFELANDLVNFVSELNINIKFNGLIISKQEISELEGGTQKSGLYNYEVSDINSEVINNIKDKTYYMLLNVASDEATLKIKKKLPKPGKSAEKVDDGFCNLQLDIKFWPKVKEVFFWDLPDFKKVKIRHTYIIDDLIMPEGEKDFEKIRLLTKRKGKIIRNITIDGSEQKKENNLVG